MLDTVVVESTPRHGSASNSLAERGESSCIAHSNCFADGDAETSVHRPTSPTTRAPEPKTKRSLADDEWLESRQLQLRTRPAEYFDGHADVEELLDPLVDGAQADETMKTKQQELDRLARSGVYETVDIPIALRKKQVTTRWELPLKWRRFVAREFEGRRNDVRGLRAELNSEHRTCHGTA